MILKTKNNINIFSIFSATSKKVKDTMEANGGGVN